MMRAIRFYQRRVSPLTPPSCRFDPTCSQYTYEAVGRFGCLAGLLLGFWRILRCNPFVHGGYDPVPEKFLGWRGRTAGGGNDQP